MPFLVVEDGRVPAVRRDIAASQRLLMRFSAECPLFCGGGSALLHASKALDAVKDKMTNFDQKIGVQIIQACSSVVRALFLGSWAPLQCGASGLVQLCYWACSAASVSTNFDQRMSVHMMHMIQACVALVPGLWHLAIGRLCSAVRQWLHVVRRMVPGAAVLQLLASCQVHGAAVLQLLACCQAHGAWSSCAGGTALLLTSHLFSSVDLQMQPPADMY
eukprot:1137035-Pelagomonas_calceolata.AAC.2